MPRQPPPPERRVLKPPEWPVHDWKLFQRHVALGDDLEDDGYGSELAKDSILKIIEGYGRWLGFLLWLGELNPEEPPWARVTPARIRRYLRLLEELRNRGHTIFGRMCELASAMRIIAPERNWKWLLRPRGIPLRSRLKMQLRPKLSIGSRELFAWGCELMDTALALPPQRRRVQYRDGLMIALMAVRRPRRRTVTCIRVCAHVFRRDGEFWLTFGEVDLKNKRPLEYPLPEELTPRVERYFAVERQELLQGKPDHGAFWVNWTGEPLGMAGVEKRIWWRSAKRFGKAFGPHQFRYDMDRTGPRCTGLEPGVTSSLMGITEGTYQGHYNRSGDTKAANKFHAGLRDLRAQTTLQARTLFPDDDEKDGKQTE